MFFLEGFCYSPHIPPRNPKNRQQSYKNMKWPKNEVYMHSITVCMFTKAGPKKYTLISQMFL